MGDVPLTNLTVTDLSVPGPNLNLSLCGFPSTLAVNGSASCIVTDVSRCASDTNIVTATANGQTGVGTSGTVTATDTNRVIVIPINVACALTVSTNNGATFFAPAGCAAQYVPGSYIVRITVTNNGSFPLQNVTLTSVAGFVGCFSSPFYLGN